MSTFRQQYINTNLQVYRFLRIIVFFPSLHWMIYSSKFQTERYIFNSRNLAPFPLVFTGSDNNDVNKFHFNDETDSIISTYLKSNQFDVTYVVPMNVPSNNQCTLGMFYQKMQPCFQILYRLYKNYNNQNKAIDILTLFLRGHS